MLFITIYLTLLFIGANCSGHLPIRGAWIGLEKQNSEMKALLLSAEDAVSHPGDGNFHTKTGTIKAGSCDGTEWHHDGHFEAQSQNG